jgi:hypothetical protein
VVEHLTDPLAATLARRLTTHGSGYAPMRDMRDDHPPNQAGWTDQSVVLGRMSSPQNERQAGTSHNDLFFTLPWVRLTDPTNRKPRSGPQILLRRLSASLQDSDMRRATYADVLWLVRDALPPMAQNRRPPYAGNKNHDEGTHLRR